MTTSITTTIDRVEAARMLHAIRAGGPERDEQIEWAACSLSDCRAVCRLMIDLHIDRGDVDAAMALIGQGLLRRPTDPSLALLRARALVARGDRAQADGPLRLALAIRPHHTATLELAGRVALEGQDPLRAAECFRKIDSARPSDRIKRLRVIALLEATRPDLARTIFEQMEVQPVLLAAQVLRVEGRLLEAIEVLAAGRGQSDGAQRQRITCGLIDLLEEAGDSTRLRAVLINLGPAETEARGRAGLAWLTLGEFTAALRAVRPLQTRRGRRGLALTVILVAATMSGRTTLAERALIRLRRLDESVDRRAVADAWSRAFLGRILKDQQCTRTTGRAGVLAGLLRDAQRVLERTLEVPEALMPARQPHLQTQLEMCHRLSSDLAVPKGPGAALIEMAAGRA